MKGRKIPFFVLFFLVIAFQIFTYRGIYFTKFNQTYARDLYDHSQYSIPLSPRSISDGLLYQVAGNDYLSSWQLFKINPEAPPLGKYIYGLSIKIFNNGQMVSIFIFILSAYLFFKISKIFLKDKLLAKIALFLYILEPLIFSQMSKTMLDLPQLVAFFLHVYAILLLVKNKNNSKMSLLFSILAGISLGFFVSIKIGFVAIAIVLTDILVFIKEKKIWLIIPVLILSFFTYVLSYLPYFIQGNDFISFLKAQKWVYNYWTTSKVKPIYGMIFFSFFTGLSKGWHKGAIWEHVPEWTILWPLYLGFFLFTLNYFVKNIKKTKTEHFYLTILIGFLLLTLMVIPLFTRYILLILPFLIIYFLIYFPTLKKWLKTILLIILVVQAYFFLYSGPVQTARDITRTWDNGAYQDMYSFLSSDSINNINRQTFWQKMQLTEKKLGVLSRKIDIKINNFYPWQKKVNGYLTINYQTLLGSLKNRHPVIFVKKNGLWQMNWNDELILKNFSFDDQIISQFSLGRFGTTRLKDGTIVSQEEIRPFFSLIPALVQDDKKIQNQLALLTGKQGYEIELLYRANSQPDKPVEIGFLKEILNTNYLQETDLVLEKAVIVDQRKTRGYNQQLLKVVNLNKVKLAEFKYLKKIDPQWYGVVIIQKPGGKKEMLQNKKKFDGKDITLEKFF